MPTSELLTQIGLIVASLVLLYFGADWLVKGSALLARAMHIRPMVIGLTVVAFATSAPELVVGLTANLTGKADMATGDVIGANVANIGLIIGLSALVRPLVVGRTVWKKEVPIVLVVQILLFAFAVGGLIDHWEGGLLMLVLVGYIFYMVRTSKELADGDELPDGLQEASPRPVRNIVQVIVGVCALAGGGYLLVHSAEQIAAAAGVTELAIGATMVAFLTTVPELATSVMAARQGEGDIAVGNAIGSCFFNTAAVLGLASAIRPIAVSDTTVWIRIPVMIGLMLVLIPLARTGARVARWEGALLLAGYLGFVTYMLWPA